MGASVVVWDLRGLRLRIRWGRHQQWFWSFGATPGGSTRAASTVTWDLQYFSWEFDEGSVSSFVRSSMFLIVRWGQRQQHRWCWNFGASSESSVKAASTAAFDEGSSGVRWRQQQLRGFVEKWDAWEASLGVYIMYGSRFYCVNGLRCCPFKVWEDGWLGERVRGAPTLCFNFPSFPLPPITLSDL